MYFCLKCYFTILYSLSQPVFVCLFYIPGTLLGARDEKVHETDNFLPIRSYLV